MTYNEVEQAIAKSIRVVECNSMKVFWYQGGIHFEPESQRETDLLMRWVPLKDPSERQRSSSSGSSELGCESIFKLLIGNHKRGPGRLTRKTGNQQAVVRIDEAP